MAHRKFNHYVRQLVAAEINRFARYYNEVIQVEPLPHDEGTLIELIDNKKNQTLLKRSQLKNASTHADSGRLIVLNGNLNYAVDIHELLTGLKAKLSRSDRIVAVVFNPYFRWLYRLADVAGAKRCGATGYFCYTHRAK